MKHPILHRPSIGIWLKLKLQGTSQGHLRPSLGICMPTSYEYVFRRDLRISGDLKIHRFPRCTRLCSPEHKQESRCLYFTNICNNMPHNNQKLLLSSKLTTKSSQPYFSLCKACFLMPRAGLQFYSLSGQLSVLLYRYLIFLALSKRE